MISRKEERAIYEAETARLRARVVAGAEDMRERAAVECERLVAQFKRFAANQCAEAIRALPLEKNSPSVPITATEILSRRGKFEAEVKPKIQEKQDRFQNEFLSPLIKRVCELCGQKMERDK